MLLIFIFSSFAALVFSLEEIYCPIPDNFVVKCRNKHKATIFDGKLTVQFARDKFKVYTYKDLEDVNFILNETFINFQGKMLIDDRVNQIKEINQTLHTRALGVSVLMEISCYDTILTQSQVLLPRNKTDRPTFPFEVENEILHMAASCLNLEFTQKIGSLLPSDFPKSKDFYDFGPLSLNPSQEQSNFCPTHEITEENKKLNSMQLALNTIVDIAVVEVKNLLKKQNLTIIKIPDVFEPYHIFSDTFIQMTATFNATHGYFRDLATIKRTSKVAIDQRNQKVSVSFGFGLETAQIDFGYYKAKYGLVSMSGNFSAAVGNIDANVKLSMDFEKQPCEAKLEYFDFEYFNDLKIKIHGNQVLDTLISKLVTSVMNKWRTEIAEFVRTVIGQLLASVLGEHNCEIYRPALIQQC